MKLGNLKLHNLSKAEMAKNEMRLTIGGNEDCSCSCTCNCSCDCATCGCSSATNPTGSTDSGPTTDSTDSYNNTDTNSFESGMGTFSSTYSNVDKSPTRGVSQSAIGLNRDL